MLRFVAAETNPTSCLLRTNCKPPPRFRARQRRRVRGGARPMPSLLSCRINALPGRAHSCDVSDACGHRCGDRRTKRSISRLTFTGSRAWGRWPAPSSTSNSPPVSSATRWLRAGGWHMSWSPLITSTGQRTRRQTSAAGSGSNRRRSSTGAAHLPRSASIISGVVPQRPLHAVLVLLRRVWFGEQLVEEELGVAPPVALPVVAVLQRPSVVALRLVVEAPGRPVRVREVARYMPGLMATTPATRSGCVAAHQRRRPAPWHTPDDDGPLDAVDVEHVDRVGDELIVGVRRGIDRSIAAAIAAWVERQHRVAPGEPWDLRLPHLRVDDRVGVRRTGSPARRRRSAPTTPARRRARRTRWRPVPAPSSVSGRVA